MAGFWSRWFRSEALYRENVAQLRAALQAVVARRAEFERHGADAHVRIANVAQFAILWNADLSALLDELRRLKRSSAPGAEWKEKLLARLLALTMIECADEFVGLLGRQFRRTVETLCEDPELLQEVGRVHKRLSDFKKEHEVHLRQVRNTIIAHRDPNASLQLEVMEKLSVDALTQLGFELLDWTNDLLHLLSSVIADTGQNRAAAGA